MVLSKDLKIAICFGLIMGAILSLCNLCFAAEEVTLTTVDQLRISTSTNEFVSGDGFGIQYFSIEPGYVYTVSNVGQYTRYYGFCDSVPTSGVSVSNVGTLTQNDDITFNGSIGYMFFSSGNTPTNIVVTREALPGMTGFIDNIVYFLSIGELSSVWVLVVPILAISVLLGLGFYLLKRLLNKIKRAKGGA